MNAFKDKFEKNNPDEEASNKTILDLNIQLKSIKEALKKVIFKTKLYYKFIFRVKMLLI